MRKENKIEPIVIPVEELYEQAPCGYISFLSDGTIFNTNKTFLDWLDYDKEEIIYTKKIQDLFSISGRIFFETHFFPLIRIQGFVNEIYFDIVSKDKTKVPILINVKEIQASEKNPITYHATLFNISDRRNYETELIKAKRKAEAESDAKARFLSTVSHEIRTPLNAIIGIGNLIHQTPLNEAQKEYARILLLSSENLLNLVNNLLDLSKLEANKISLEKRPFNLFELIEFVESVFDARATEKEIDLIVSIDENIPEHLLGDSVKLNQILFNIIGNSIKFTNYGSVMLEVNLIAKDKKQATVEFQVTDTGIGIEKDKLENVFQEFSQASYDVGREFGGTGLGLTICQRLLQLYNSELIVSSEYGKGSEFSFQIVYDINEHHTPSNKSAIASFDDHIFDDYRVLIVDDNKDNIFIASQYLKQWNVPYDTATNGEEALEMVKLDIFDLILMDMQMPIMNGFECSKEIRKLKLSKSPTIVAFSASTKEEIMKDLLEADIDDHLSKPFQPKELKELLIHYLQSPTTKQHQVEVEPTHSDHSNPTLTTQNDTSFSTATYEKMANGKLEYVHKFLKSAKNALHEYEIELDEAVVAKDAQAIASLIHQSTMTLYHLEANSLSEKLKRCHSAMLSKSDEKVQARAMACKEEIHSIQEGIQTYLNK